MFVPVGASQHLGPVSDDEALGDLTRQPPSCLGTVGLSLNTAYGQFLHKETERRAFTDRRSLFESSVGGFGRMFYSRSQEISCDKCLSPLNYTDRANLKSQQRRHLLVLLLTSA